MTAINRNKVGTFKIQDLVIEDQPEIVLDIMSRVIVLKAGYLDIEGAYEYYGFSEMFDEVDDELIILVSEVIKNNNTLKERLRNDAKSRNMLKCKNQKEINILDLLFEE